MQTANLSEKNNGFILPVVGSHLFLDIYIGNNLKVAGMVTAKVGIL